VRRLDVDEADEVDRGASAGDLDQRRVVRRD
jgi:hypothetical protein